ncbi:MAG: helix-turn-helix transcriptional regulator [Wenzhouxiangella sp.]
MRIAETVSSDSISQLWDQLAGFPASRADEAFEYLLRESCRLFHSWNVGWISAVRMPDATDQDPVRGWRPRESGYLFPSEAIEQARLEQYRRLEAGEVDPSTLANLRDAGRWRARKLADLVEREWFHGDYYQRFFAATGRADVLWIGCPISPDVELFIGLFRTADQPSFSDEDCHWALQLMRGLKWFFIRHLLGHGLLAAETPLTPAERRVLLGLLEGLSEEEIAGRLQRSQHTIHHHCKMLYRKFGVSNRASLMAIWLGTALPTES